MDVLRRIKPEEDELAAFTQAVRSTLVESREPAASSTLVAKLAATARAASATADAPSAPRPRRERARMRLASAGIALALVPALMASLAVAGVKLPGPAGDAFESVGVELPNQGPSSDPGGRDPGDDAQRPAAGGAVDEGAEKPAPGHGKEKSNPAREGGRANGRRGRGRALGRRGLAPGQAKSKGSKSNGSKSKGSNKIPPASGGGKPPAGNGNGGGNGKK